MSSGVLRGAFISGKRIMRNQDNDIYFSLTPDTLNKDVSVLSVTAFLYFTRYSFLAFARTFSLSTAVIGGGMMILFLAFFGIYTVMKPENISWDGIALVSAAVVLFEMTILFHPEYQYRYDDLVRDGRYGVSAVFSFGAAIYTFYLIRLFRTDGEKLYRLFMAVAYVIFICEIWTALINRAEDYMMVFGYQMELASIIFLSAFLKDTHEKSKLVLSIACIALGVLFGARGCIIGYVVFIGVFLLWKSRIDRKQIMLLSCIVFGAAATRSAVIMRILYNLFLSVGFQSRTLFHLAEGSILSVDTARQDNIWPPMISKLKSLPVFEGMGAYGDRTLISTYYPHAHNFILEILLTFGVLAGGLFLIWVMIQFIKVIRFNKNDLGLITLIFGCFSLCKLFLSSTFWQEPYFWSFIAMLVNCIGDRKRNRYSGGY